MKKILFTIVTLFFIAINAWGEDGNVLSEYTVEGILMKFKVISEEEKTCQVKSSAIYSDTEGKVTIPSTVKGYTVIVIGDYAFSYCKTITEVLIPNSVEKIGLSAFSGCSLLETITIPDAVYNIGGGAFYGTKWLDNQPNGLVYAGKVLYMYKGSMPTNTSLSLRDGTLGIVSCAFVDCSNLVSINMPSSVKHIGSGAFSGCSNLVTVNLPQSLATLGGYAFYNCKKITSILIPDLLESIEECTFAGCSSLNDVSIGKKVKFINNDPWLGAFVDCNNIKKLSVDCKRLDILPLPSVLTNNIEELIIGNNLQIIGHYTFCGNPQLKKVSIGKNVPSIEGFSGCTSLEEVILSEGNRFIREDAFSGCIKLSHFSFPSTIIEIGALAFSECGFEVFNIPESISRIDYGAFQYCTNLRTINIPSKITRLEDYLLSGTGLTSFDIPSHVTSLGMGVFSGCTKLESLTASENLFSVGRDAFDRTPWLESQQNGVFYLGSVACGYHGEMPENTTIRLKDTTRGIAACAFAGQSNIIDIVLPNELDNIGDAAFQNSGLTSITIPKGLLSLGCETFAYCHNLRKIVFHDTPDYGCYNFFNCINLTDIYAYMEHPKSIDDYFFYDDAEENWFDVYNNATLYVPAKYKSIYENTGGWNKFKNIVALPDYSNNQLFGEDLECVIASTSLFEVVLANENEVKLCQFDLRLPDGVTVMTNSNGKLDARLTERAEGHSVSGTRLSNGDYRFVISSMDNDSFTENEGTLLEIMIEIPATMEAGEYTVKVLNVELSIPEGNDLKVVKPADTESILTVKDYTPGDVNNDGSVSVTDVGCAINYILEQVPSVFIFEAADMNCDKSVSVTDVGMIINLILNEGAASRRTEQMTLKDAQLSLMPIVDGYELLLEDKDAFIGFQFDVELEEGATISDMQLDSDSDHVLTCRKLSNGKWRVVCYSPTNSSFSSNRGAGLLTINTERTISLGDIRLTTAGFDEQRPAPIVGTPTDIASIEQGMKMIVEGGKLCINSDRDTTLRLYSLSGSIYRTLQVRKGRNSFDGLRKGIYMINSQKVIVQ